MNIRYGKGRTKYGPGVSIELDGNEVATAIDAWLVAHGVHVSGPRTITVNGELCEAGNIYVDPSGFVINPEGEKMPGGPASVVSVDRKELEELKAENAALATALTDVMLTEQLRDLAHCRWQNAQEDKAHIGITNYDRAKENNSSAASAHHDALNKARALFAARQPAPPSGRETPK